MLDEMTLRNALKFAKFLEHKPQFFFFFSFCAVVLILLMNV